MHGQDALWAAHNGTYLMNAIPYFDYSLAPFWPSYQNKIIGVLNRVLREQSCSRIRRILLRLPGEH
ncbi:hypothetical protein ACEA70_25560, partial [Escherichia coli]